MPANKLLIISADPTYSGLARLPKALKSAGFEVAALCLPNAFLAKTRYLDQIFPLAKTMDSAKLLRQLIKVVKDWQPTMLIYGDEMTVAFAHYVVQHAAKFSAILPEAVLALFKASLGDPHFFEATLLKHKTLEVAKALGLRIPAMASVTTGQQAWQFAEKIGYPLVLKKDFSCSGVGVKICRSQAEFASALPAFLPTPLTPLRASLRKLLRKDWFPVEKVLSLQQFVQGSTAMYPLVAMNGEILAGFSAVKELTCSETGPSSVIRLTNHAEMQTTATALIKQFQFTGFASFDFLIEEGTEHAYLLECNSRPVPVCHLGALAGVNLGKALFNRINDQLSEPQTIVKQETFVSLFPQEWQRDPESVNLRHIYHDVPWDDPALVKAYIA